MSCFFIYYFYWPIRIWLFFFFRMWHVTSISFVMVNVKTLNLWLKSQSNLELKIRLREKKYNFLHIKKFLLGCWVVNEKQGCRLQSQRFRELWIDAFFIGMGFSEGKIGKEGKSLHTFFFFLLLLYSHPISFLPSFCQGFAYLRMFVNRARSSNVSFGM